MTPSVGRIVHFFPRPEPGVAELEPVPALILQVRGQDGRHHGLDEDAYDVLLLVHHPENDVRRRKVPFSMNPAAGCWSWPPRV